jgi:transcriptional regulator with XRE-family HTH domain
MNVINQNAQDSLADTPCGRPARFRKRGITAVDALVGARLRLMREESRTSRRDMAAALGISVQQLSKYEVGSNRMSVGFLYQAASCLDLPVQALLVDAGEDTAQPAAAPEGEEAVVRFVMRYIQANGARRDMTRILMQLLTAAPVLTAALDRTVVPPARRLAGQARRARA